MIDPDILARLEAWIAREIPRPCWRPRLAAEERQRAEDVAAVLAEIGRLTAERDEARQRYSALDGVDTDLWRLACDVVNGRPGTIDFAAELVRKYDAANPDRPEWCDLNKRGDDGT